MRIQKRDIGEVIGRVKDVISRAANTKLGLREISQSVGVSPSHLAATFKKVERTTIHRYLVHLRLQRAASLLAGCDDLTTLALNLGFASQSHFSNAFRRWAGVTPGKYRARLRAAVTMSAM